MELTPASAAAPAPSARVTIANNSDLTFQGGTYNNGLTIGREGGTGTVSSPQAGR